MSFALVLELYVCVANDTYDIPIYFTIVHTLCNMRIYEYTCIVFILSLNLSIFLTILGGFQHTYTCTHMSYSRTKTIIAKLLYYVVSKESLELI